MAIRSLSNSATSKSKITSQDLSSQTNLIDRSSKSSNYGSQPLSDSNNNSNNNKKDTAPKVSSGFKVSPSAYAAFRKAERNVDSNQARKLLKQRIAQEEDSPSKDLYEYAAKLPKDCQPASDADQTSSFVLAMSLNFLCLHRDTATTATLGSLIVRMYKNLESLPKHPDLLVRYREITYVSEVEVSLVPYVQTDLGDLCRVALWSK
ncbi:hypothetical protein BGZ98_008955 [Dissophora globulifera]|nr:hypothetical protein BGZ98_008955 [Dissophora globulifera]